MCSDSIVVSFSGGCRSGLLKQEDVGRRCATKPTHSIITEHTRSTGIPDLLREGCLCQLCTGKHTFAVCVCSPDGAHSDESTPDASQAIYAEFDDDFEDEELAAPIGKCTAMYNFPGMSSDDGLSRVSAGICIYVCVYKRKHLTYICFR